MKLNLSCTGVNDGYQDLILTHVNRQVPQASITNQQTLVDILADVLYSTKNLRFGPIPEIEAQATVRNVIREYTRKTKPIPVLVPWGSIKANFSPELDIAELSAIQTLVNLNKCIKQWYTPGLQIVVRIEDTSGFRLFAMEQDYDRIVASSNAYSENLRQLVLLLSEETILPRLESSMPNAESFDAQEHINTGFIFDYLYATREGIDTSIMEYQRLQSIGWKGVISMEQREHYLSQYRKLYHDYDELRLLKRLAMYFGGSLTRHQLGMTGKLDAWNNKFIQLAFIPPIKGLPEGYNHNYVYYRTVPMNQSRTHLAPWRAKGYLRIEGRQVASKLSTFNSLDLDLEQTYIRLSNDKYNVLLRADYHVL